MSLLLTALFWAWVGLALFMFLVWLLGGWDGR